MVLYTYAIGKMKKKTYRKSKLRNFEGILIQSSLARKFLKKKKKKITCQMSGNESEIATIQITLRGLPTMLPYILT